jgi:hypothetical protein
MRDMKGRRKLLSVAVIGLFFGAGVIASIAESPNESYMLDDVDQSQTEYDSGAVVCSWYVWGQSFIPTKEILSGVELNLGRWGLMRSDVIISIRKDLDGEDLTKTTIPYDSVPLTAIWKIPVGNPDWIYVDFADISVLTGETYYILVTSDGGFGSMLAVIGCYVWSNNHNPDSYIGGECWFSYVRRDPTPWKIWDSPFDFCFKTYGHD